MESVLGRDDLKASFSEWRKGAIRNVIERREKIGMDDRGPITGLLIDHSNDPLWIEDW